MIYVFIKNNEKIFPIEKMCKVLHVGQRSYYQWKSQSVSDRKQRVVLVEKTLFILSQNNVTVALE
jgi:hypothetical protein